MVLRACYSILRTDAAYGPTLRCAMLFPLLSQRLVLRKSHTNGGYGATLFLTERMVLRARS
eukprot:3328295-Rhodomonas_salina.1